MKSLPGSKKWEIFFLTLLFATIIGRSYSFLLLRTCDVKILQATSTSPCLNNQNSGVNVNRVVCTSSRATSLCMTNKKGSLSEASSWIQGDPHVETVLFVECGFGNDSHGEFLLFVFSDTQNG